MPSPAFDAQPLASDDPAPAASWSDCPRCGEHWPANSPYCGNCGWTPEAAPSSGRGTRLTERALRGPLPAIALGALALIAVAWAWLERGPSAPASAGAATAASAANASTPATTSATTVVKAVTTAASAVAPPVTQAQAETRVAVPPETLAERFAREWLAAETALVPADNDPGRAQPLYAERVNYHGRPGTRWPDIAADKAELIRRWPLRRYELLAVRHAHVDADGLLRAELRLRWRLENQGRWRAGESTAVLQLRHLDGQWRIVAEGGS